MNTFFHSQNNDVEQAPALSPHSGHPQKSRFASGVRRVVGATFGALIGTYVVALNTSPQIALPNRPALPGRNSFPMLKAAVGELVRHEEVSDAVKKNPAKSRTFAEKQGLVAANYSAIMQAREALRYPYYEENHTTSLNTETLPCADFRRLVRTQALAGNVAWEKGKQREATDYYLDGITVGRRIPHRVGLIPNLVGIACESIGRTPLWKRIDRMDADTATHTLARLEALQSERLPYSETLEEEKFSMQSGINAVLEQPKQLEEVLGSEDIHPVIRAYCRVVPRKYIVDTMGAQMDKVIAQSKNPYILDHEELPLPSEIMTKIMMPVLTIARCKHVASEAADNLLRTALALHIYQLQNGRHPEKLSDLVEAKIMAQMPEDPFAIPGTSLRYARQEDGKYLLYSVGPDGVDDGGKGIDNNYPQSSTNRVVSSDSKGDMVAGWYAY